VLGFGSFASAAVAFAILAALILIKGTATRTGRLFVIAITFQIIWAAAFASAYTVYALPTWLLSVTEAVRTLVWTLFLLSFAQEASVAAAGSKDPASIRWIRNLSRGTHWTTFFAAGLCSATIALDIALTQGMHVGSANLGIKVIAAVVGLWCLEQLYRNISTNLRWAIKFLCIALVALFGYDMAMYTEALLFERVNYAWMTGRGFANAVLVPLFAIAAVRNRSWKVDIMVSRTVVFHSTTLIAAGIFLIAMSTVGYYVRYFGGMWGEVAQALVLFIGLILLLVMMLSGQIRARIRVFLAKNFFSYRYDYRDEWLALTRALGDRKLSVGQAGIHETQPLTLRALLALARFVEASEGAIWLAGKDGNFRPAASVPENMNSGVVADQPLERVVLAGDAFVEFMRAKEWVVLIPEMAKRKDLYGDVALPKSISGDPLNWLVVPLLRGDDAIGFVTLRKPSTPMELDWEVRDILKTAARQTASYLAVERAVEELVVARQFESFNRMSAFVVHDLKNLVAQLSLLLANATRHRHNPEFQDDMLATVENVMTRMQGLLLQLRAGTKPMEQAVPVDVSSIVADAVDSKKSSHIKPTVSYSTGAQSAQIRAHADRLARVVGHLVQNATEACGNNGKIAIDISTLESQLLLKVSDNGHGMTEQFIQTQLFKPFQSTKAHGMGIGTFESKEYIGELGGSLSVQSVEGKGTTFTIQLPLANQTKPNDVFQIQNTA
jgi:putative PEP-CTERM system histidine kinase